MSVSLALLAVAERLAPSPIESDADAFPEVEDDFENEYGIPFVSCEDAHTAVDPPRHLSGSAAERRARLAGR